MTNNPSAGAHELPNPQKSSQWLTLAIASGAFASFNGVFAKLTTTSQTRDTAASISHFLGFASNSPLVELLTRGFFFGLNLICNAIMWILFTRALTASSSTTRVSILNVSSNFLVTALLGMVVFAEALPLGWWLGACFLIAGSIVTGRREEEVQSSGQVQSNGEAFALQADNGYTDDDSRPAEAEPESLGLDKQGKFRDDPDQPNEVHEGDQAQEPLSDAVSRRGT